MAPGANIVLVVASTSSGNALNVAEALAIQRYPGSVMSQSFGIPEIVVHNNNAQILQAHQNYLAAQAAGITVLASAGDFGATNGFATPNALFPSSDPLVTAVGGTQGNPYPGGLASCGETKCKGVYGGEEVWNEPAFGAAGGGAPSLLFGVPPYQASLGMSARATPDISYNAGSTSSVAPARARRNGPRLSRSPIRLTTVPWVSSIPGCTRWRSREGTAPTSTISSWATIRWWAHPSASTRDRVGIMLRGGGPPMSRTW